VNEWLRAYNAVNNQTPQLMVNTKKLTEQRENLLVWQQLVEQHFAPKRIDGKQVAVFDTSYLMKHSDKLTEISQRQFIIIPQIVLHELDGLKGGNDDEQTERIKQARYAIRIIHSLSEINFESSHTELWHFINDSKNKRDLNGDQQILSVALYHQLNAATLYSLDINLCNLAKLVSIQIAG
jgi:predicted ribonuclease YlaK